MSKQIKFYGIDESNNERYPEIHVIVPSYKFKDIQPKSFKKDRRTATQLIQIQKNSEFLYTVITKDESELYLENDRINKTFVAYLTLLQQFNNGGSVYIDGLLNSKVCFLLKKYFGNKFSFLSGPKLDEIIPLVHSADSIANHLFRNHLNKNLNRRRRYLESFLNPNYKEALEIIKDS